MRFEELRFVCEEAAKKLLADHERPLPPTVVLPGPERTQLVTLPGFPDDDEARHDLLANLATDEIVAKAIPAWGFLAEADVGGVPAVIAVYGARKHAPRITAAAVEGTSLREFQPEEELDPTAMPFLHPLQHAVDSLPAVETVDRTVDLLGGEGPA